MKQTKGKTISSRTKLWVALSCVALALVLCCIMTQGFVEWNPYCWAGHDYNENNVCIRCGKDKPIENGDETNAAVSELYTLYAEPPASSNAEQILADLHKAGLSRYCNRSLKVGDNWDDIGDTDVFIYTGPLSGDSYTELLFNANLDVFLHIEKSGGVYKASVQAEGNEEYLNDEFASVYDDELQGFFFDMAEQDAIRVFADDNAVESVENTFFVFVKDRNLEQPLPANPSKTGYSFTGWYTDAACTNKYTASTVTGNITLYAGFRAHTYNVKFNANSGSGNMANEAMTYDQAKNLTANAFTKEHYIFKGWATSANGDVVYSNSQSVKNLTAADGGVIELFAVWELNEISVTFNADGKTSTVWITKGTSVTLPDNPVKDGHTFEAWYMADGTKYNNQTLSENVTLTAKFNIIRCTVTFMVDGEVYSVYTCDWGTNLSELLNANGVNPALLTTEDEYSSNF